MTARNLRTAIGRTVAATVGWLRAVSGDDAYERYLTHHAHTHEGAPMGRRAFYEEREKRKWSGVSRCC
jgi:uncharacterized short protein YbdD (DUF466 family)